MESVAKLGLSDFLLQILEVDTWSKNWRETYNLQVIKTQDLNLSFPFSFQVWDLNLENKYKVNAACYHRNQELFAQLSTL